MRYSPCTMGFMNAALATLKFMRMTVGYLANRASDLLFAYVLAFAASVVISGLCHLEPTYAGRSNTWMSMVVIPPLLCVVGWPALLFVYGRLNVAHDLMWMRVHFMVWLSSMIVTIFVCYCNLPNYVGMAVVESKLDVAPNSMWKQSRVNEKVREVFGQLEEVPTMAFQLQLLEKVPVVALFGFVVPPLGLYLQKRSKQCNCK